MGDCSCAAAAVDQLTTAFCTDLGFERIAPFLRSASDCRSRRAPSRVLFYAVPEKFQLAEGGGGGGLVVAERVIDNPSTSLTVTASALLPTCFVVRPQLLDSCTSNIYSTCP